MAAFSYQQHHTFPLDTLFLPPKLSHSGVEESINANCVCQLYPPESLPQGSSCLDHTSSKHTTSENNEPSDSVTKKQNTESSSIVDLLEKGEQVTQRLKSSSVVDLLGKGEQVTQRLNPMEKKRKNTSTCAQPKGKAEEMKKRQKNSRDASKKEEEKKQKAEKAVEKKGPEEPPKGYIHVRARRGQATDSHSLAERVRREKISERMRILQSLVPGCEKVTGKALVLDEIINYVQSLQNQVEFLSMKLTSMNPMLVDFSLDLDAFSLHEQKMNSLLSTSPSLPSLAQCSPNQQPSTLTAAANNYPLMDTSASLLLHQAQRPNLIAFSQDEASMLWDVDDQRQKFLNPSGFGNNLCSFH